MVRTIRQFLSRLLGLRAPQPLETQSGALPYRIVDGRVVYLLITSRRSARWMFPKGRIEPGRSPWENAAQEALEEAGIEGEVGTTLIGSYRGVTNDESQTPVIVDIYPLRVGIEHDDWREKHQRQRRWVSFEDAQRLLDPEKRAIVEAFEKRLAAAKELAR